MVEFNLVEYPVRIQSIAADWFRVRQSPHARVTLYAPPGYTSLNRELRHKICNGCGPGNWKFDVVPDTIYGLSIREVCNIHDYMYYYGLLAHDKWFADAVFLLNGCLLVMWTTKWKVLRVLRTMRMVWYYLAVANFGDRAFLHHENGVRSAHHVHDKTDKNNKIPK